MSDVRYLAIRNNKVVNITIGKNDDPRYEWVEVTDETSMVGIGSIRDDQGIFGTADYFSVTDSLKEPVIPNQEI